MKPPVKLPEPIDLTENPGETKFSFYRTFPHSGSLPKLPPLLKGGESFRPDVGYRLAKISYSLEEHSWREKSYYHLVREVVDGQGKAIGSIPKRKVYRSMRLKHLIVFFHERERKDIFGKGGRRGFGGRGGGFGGRGGRAGGPGGHGSPPDFVYYIQFLVTGLSTQLRSKEFEDFQKNMLVNVICFDALTEKLRRENAALYWKSHGEEDGYVKKGNFDL